MKKSQSTLEYVFLIATVVSAFLAVLMYVSRGMQGSLRNSADQLGADQYAPGQTTGNHSEVKNTQSASKTNVSTTTTTPGVVPEDPSIAAAKDVVDKDKEDLAKLTQDWQDAMMGTEVSNPEGYNYAEEYAKNATPLPAARNTADLEVKIKAMQKKLDTDLATYKDLVKNAPKPGESTSVSSDTSEQERGSISTSKFIDESLSKY